MSTIKTKKKGFTLIELIVSIFVFLIVMTAILNIFVSHVAVYRHARVMQRNVESGQFALNYVAKTMRTGTIINASSSQLTVYDFSQPAGCFRFTFDSSAKALRVDQATESAGIDEAGCASFSFSGSSISFELTTGEISGSFDVVKTVGDKFTTPSINETVIGRATIQLTVDHSVRARVMPTYLQTSVSLRDYPGGLSF